VGAPPALVLALPVGYAAATATTIAFDVQVVAGQRVAVNAVGGEDLRPERDGAADILEAGDDLEMLRVDAVANPTAMIQLMPVWNRSTRHFVRHAVSAEMFALRRAPNSPVASALGANPQDAACHRVRARVDTKPLLK
jgi:hypothetical protein